MSHNSAPALNRHIKKLKQQKEQAGTLLSFTTIHNPPAGFGSEAYHVGIIELADGTRTCAQLTPDGFTPTIGAKVAPRLRRIRTLENGLFVNDYKYEVLETAPEVKLHIQHYVLALTGPSGVGKTTITHTLLSLFSPTEQLPVYTTRKPKKNDSEPYVHISKEEFDRLVASKEMIAHTTMESSTELRYYGYCRKDIEKIWAKGKLPLVVTDINLLKGLSESLGRRAILSCGLLPPGKSRRRMLSNLLHRLRGRGRDTEDQIQERLKVAEFDLAAFDQHPHLFDHLVVNDKLETCVEHIGTLLEPGIRTA